MLPGARDESFDRGGFEIIVGSLDFALRREEILAMWRDHHIAVKGLHVIDRNQIVGPPELPEGTPLTSEIREAIARARLAAGKVLLPLGVRGRPGDPQTDYNVDPELNGVVAKPDWHAIGANIDAKLAEMTYCPPQELPCPGPEAAAATNTAFWELFQTNRDEATRIAKEFAEWHVMGTSKTMLLWPPQRSGGALAERFMPSEFITVTAQGICDLRGISEKSITFRNWLASKICTAIADKVDFLLKRELENAPCGLTALRDPLGYLKAQRPEHTYIYDYGLQDALGIKRGTSMGLPGREIIVGSLAPLPRNTVLVRGTRGALDSTDSKRPLGTPAFCEDSRSYSLSLTSPEEGVIAVALQYTAVLDFGIPTHIQGIKLA